MLDYATQLHWLYILYQGKAINSDEFIRIKKGFVGEIQHACIKEAFGNARSSHTHKSKNHWGE